LERVDLKGMHRIRDLRKEKGMSGEELATKLNISTPFLYDIEKERRTLSMQMAIQLSEIFGVTTDYLIGKSKDRNNPIPNQESELTEIPIEKLNSYKLTYAGKELSAEEVQDMIKLLKIVLKHWK
jgi:transcriptional regulator with XRE-family HTH domain